LEALGRGAQNQAPAAGNQVLDDFEMPSPSRKLLLFDRLQARLQPERL
jgi:hypothetical protein